jgi:hypothetical protein
MKIEAKCKECNDIHICDRYCKLIDGRCVNVEDSRFDCFDFVNWCEKCFREDGPLKSLAELASIAQAKEEKNKRLGELKVKYKKKECPHPKEFLSVEEDHTQYQLKWTYRCGVCEKYWEKKKDMLRDSLYDWIC